VKRQGLCWEGIVRRGGGTSEKIEHREKRETSWGKEKIMRYLSKKEGPSKKEGLCRLGGLRVHDLEKLSQGEEEKLLSVRVGESLAGRCATELFDDYLGLKGRSKKHSGGDCA